MFFAFSFIPPFFVSFHVFLFNSFVSHLLDIFLPFFAFVISFDWTFLSLFLSSCLAIHQNKITILSRTVMQEFSPLISTAGPRYMTFLFNFTYVRFWIYFLLEFWFCLFDLASRHWVSSNRVKHEHMVKSLNKMDTKNSVIKKQVLRHKLT